jgi:hypothetical protein
MVFACRAGRRVATTLIYVASELARAAAASERAERVGRPTRASQDHLANGVLEQVCVLRRNRQCQPKCSLVAHDLLGVGHV